MSERERKKDRERYTCERKKWGRQRKRKNKIEKDMTERKRKNKIEKYITETEKEKGRHRKDRERKR